MNFDFDLQNTVKGFFYFKNYVKEKHYSNWIYITGKPNPVELVPVSETEINATYYPQDEGPATVDVKYAGQPVPGRWVNRLGQFYFNLHICEISNFSVFTNEKNKS
jgi:hypothetical protein